MAEIIEPRVILCLGRSTFEGVLASFGEQFNIKAESFNHFIESTDNPVLVQLSNGKEVYIFALAHCGVMGTLNRNRKKCAGLDKQILDWKKINFYL